MSKTCMLNLYDRSIYEYINDDSTISKQCNFIELVFTAIMTIRNGLLYIVGLTILFIIISINIEFITSINLPIDNRKIILDVDYFTDYFTKDNIRLKNHEIYTNNDIEKKTSSLCVDLDHKWPINWMDNIKNNKGYNLKTVDKKDINTNNVNCRLFLEKTKNKEECNNDLNKLSKKTSYYTELTSISNLYDRLHDTNNTCKSAKKYKELNIYQNKPFICKMSINNDKYIDLTYRIISNILLWIFQIILLLCIYSLILYFISTFIIKSNNQTFENFDIIKIVGILIIPLVLFNVVLFILSTFILKLYDKLFKTNYSNYKKSNYKNNFNKKLLYFIILFCFLIVYIYIFIMFGKTNYINKSDIMNKLTLKGLYDFYFTTSGDLLKNLYNNLKGLSNLDKNAINNRHKKRKN